MNNFEIRCKCDEHSLVAKEWGAYTRLSMPGLPHYDDVPVVWLTKEACGLLITKLTAMMEAMGD